MPNPNIQIGRSNGTMMPGFINENHLGAAMLRKPHLMEDIIYHQYNKYTLTCLTAGTGRISKITENTNPGSHNYKLLGSSRFQWYIMGLQGKLYRVLTPPNHDGFNGVPFSIEVAAENDQQSFYPGEMIRFPSGIHARVVSEGLFTGHGVVYQMVFLKKTQRLLPVDMNMNAELIVGYNTYGEDSNQGYSRAFVPFAMENHFTTLRHGYGATGMSLASTCFLKFKGQKASQGDTVWFYEQERQQMDQWFQKLEYAFWFGTSSMNPDGTSDARAIEDNNYPIIAGSGIFEQLKYSVRRQYTPGQTTVKFWDDIMKELIINSNDADAKDYVFVGGIEAVSEFNRAFMEYTRGSSNVVTDRLFYDVKGNELTMKGQFTKYQGLFGNSISVVHCPMFDNPMLFGNSKHPLTGRPVMSYTAVILDFSNYNGIPNIEFLARGEGNQDRRWLMTEVPGIVNTKGKKMEFSGSSRDSTRVEYLAEVAVNIRMRQSCAWIEASVEQF